MNHKLSFSVALLTLSLGSAAIAADPKANWEEFCASCHGHDGAGHTRNGRMVRVVDLTDGKILNSFTDAQAFASIKNGKVVKGVTKMKPFGDRLSDDEINALVAYLRTFKKA